MTDDADLRNAFFDSYLSTHHVPRKGVVDENQLRSRTPRWEKMLRRFLPKNQAADIVDIGCGYGAVVWWLHQIGYRNAAGIDISPEQIATAKRLGIENVDQADLWMFLKERTGSFDLILARDVFEHFDRPALVQILTLIKAALKEDGTLVFQVPNAESPFGGRIRYGDFTHELAFTASSVSQLMHVVGFSEVRVYPVEPVVFGPNSFFRLAAWKAVQWVYQMLITIEVGRGPWVVSQNLLGVARP